MGARIHIGLTQQHRVARVPLMLAGTTLGARAFL